MYMLAFAVYILLSLLSTYPVLKYDVGSLRFSNGMVQVVYNLFYVFIGFNLYRLISAQQQKKFDLISKKALGRICNIWYALVALLSTKLVLGLLIKFYVIPQSPDAYLSDELGYSAKMSITPHSDLLIAIVVVWCFIIALNYAIKTKEEQELTI